ncbi:MAG: hypothetical protein R2824_22275 [Saprospiraceae bacterium]|nr:hypothetical protein [Lewinella sp.]
MKFAFSITFLITIFLSSFHALSAQGQKRKYEHPAYEKFAEGNRLLKQDSAAEAYAKFLEGLALTNPQD